MAKKLQRLCDHVFTNGDCCGAVALTNSEHCYWHHGARDRRRRQSAVRTKSHNSAVNIPILEDANAIQVAIQEVIEGILDQRIEHRAAGQVLYAIQLATGNISNLRFSESISSRSMSEVPDHGDLMLPHFKGDETRENNQNEEATADSAEQSSLAGVPNEVPSGVPIEVPRIPPSGDKAGCETAADASVLRQTAISTT